MKSNEEMQEWLDANADALTNQADGNKQNLHETKQHEELMEQLS